MELSNFHGRLLGHVVKRLKKKSVSLGFVLLSQSMNEIEEPPRDTAFQAALSELNGNQRVFFQQTTSGSDVCGASSLRTLVVSLALCCGID